MKRIVTTAALMVLAVTAATASPSGEIDPDLAPSLYAVPLFNHAGPVRYGDLDLAEVAAAVCSLVSTILTDDGLHAAYVLQEEAAADYSPAELADDRWQEHGVRLFHVGEGPARRTYILIDDQDRFAGFVEQEAENAAANGMTEPALSLLRDMLWEYAPRLSILPSDGSRDPLIRGRLDAVQRATCQSQGGTVGTANKVQRRVFRALAFLGGGALYALDSDSAQGGLSKEIGRAMVKYGMYGLSSLDDR